jgi:hypothetical protein
MGAPDLIFELRRKGYSIMADGCYLDVSPADNLPPELVQQLKQNKSEILVELQRETEDLQAAAGDDWPDIQDDPEALDALAKAIQTRRMRERGEVPPHYTSTTTCKHCGAVPIFEGSSGRVEGCPWCLNRGAGLPLPKALH